MLKRSIIVLLSVLWAASAAAQWQTPSGTIPVGRGAGVTGFSTVGGSSGAGTKCLLDTTPPTFGSCAAGSEQIYENKAAVAAANISAGVKIVRTLGYTTANDNGGALYVRYGGACTAISYRVQSADGQCWTLGQSDIVTIEMFGAVGDSGITDNTTAFRSFTTWINAGGTANVLNFKENGDYLVWRTGTTPTYLFEIININGLTVNFNGARIFTDNSFSPQGSPYVFAPRNSRNLIFNDPFFEQTVLTSTSSAQGASFFNFGDAALGDDSSNIIINNTRQIGGILFFNMQNTVKENTTGRVSINNAVLTSVYYGLLFQSAGDNVFARNVVCNSCGRVYFPQNVKNHDIEASSSEGANNSSVLLKVYPNPLNSASRNTLQNIKVNIHSRGWVPFLPSSASAVVATDFQQVVTSPTVSNAVNNGSGLIRLTVSSTADMLTGQTWFVNSVGGVPNATGTWTVTVISGTTVDLQGSTFAGVYTSGGYMSVPGYMRDINVTINAEGTFMPSLFLTQKRDAAGVVDTNADGYILENWIVRATGKDLNNSRSAINLWNNDTEAQGVWTGDTIRNITLKDVALTGSASAILVNAAPVESNMVIENVIAPSTIPCTFTGTGANTRIENVTCTGVSDRQAVVPSTAGANQFATGVSAITGAISYAQPAASGLSGLGTGVATALGINIGTAGSVVTNGSTVNLNINGTVGVTTPAAGLFTTVDSPVVRAAGTLTNINGTTGSEKVTLILGGGSGVNGGSTVQFAKNTAANVDHYFGHESAIFGGGSTSSNIVLYNAGISGGLAGRVFTASNTDNSVAFASTVDGTSGTAGAINTLGGIGATKAIWAGTSVTATTFASVGTKIRAAGSTPTITAGCNGAGSSIVGSDLAGTVTGQTAAATTCTITFNAAYAATPHCVVSGLTSPLTGAVTPSTTTLAVNFASTANYQFSYICMARSGG